MSAHTEQVLRDLAETGTTDHIEAELRREVRLLRQQVDDLRIAVAQLEVRAP